MCKVTVFLTDMADLQTVNADYARSFTANPPTRSCVAAAALPKGGRVAVEAIAVLQAVPFQNDESGPSFAERPASLS